MKTSSTSQREQFTIHSLEGNHSRGFEGRTIFPAGVLSMRRLFDATFQRYRLDLPKDTSSAMDMGVPWGPCIERSMRFYRQLESVSLTLSETAMGLRSMTTPNPSLRK